MSSEFQGLTESDGAVKTVLGVPSTIIYLRGYATDGENFIVKEWDGNETIYFNAGVAVNGTGVILINPNQPIGPGALDGGLEVDANGILYAGVGIIDVIHQAVGLDSDLVGGILRVTVGAASVPPAAPTVLTAVASLTLPQIQLDWVDNATNEAGYALERNETGAVGPWTEDIALPAGSDSYLDMGLTANTQYWYRVRAFNGAGPSAWSNVATATVGDVLNQRITGAGDVRITGNADRRVVP
jgi:hypothetical protein